MNLNPANIFIYCLDFTCPAHHGYTAYISTQQCGAKYSYKAPLTRGQMLVHYYSKLFFNELWGISLFYGHKKIIISNKTVPQIRRGSAHNGHERCNRWLSPNPQPAVKWGHGSPSHAPQTSHTSRGDSTCTHLSELHGGTAVCIKCRRSLI